jgi:hypothetical protein
MCTLDQLCRCAANCEKEGNVTNELLKTRVATTRWISPVDMSDLYE